MRRTDEGCPASSKHPHGGIGATIPTRAVAWLFLVVFLAVCSGLFAQEGAVELEANHYTSAQASDYGIGKIYMGREIGVIMSPEGARWLDRGARAREERPDLLLEAMRIQPDWVVADIGAGSGYYTFRLSSRVSEGRVLAVEIQPEMLQLIEKRAALAEISNVETVLGSVQDPALPESAVDAALLVDSYHEFTHPREMMAAILRALKPGGQVFLVEFRGEDAELEIPPEHKMTEAQARMELEAAGLEWVENRSVLPLHHFLVFRKP